MFNTVLPENVPFMR